MEDATDKLINNRTKPGAKSQLREYTESIAWAVILVLLIRTCIVQPFVIPSGSMENTLLVGDRLLANKFIYGIEVPFTSQRLLKIRNPKRGDVVIFKYPLDRSQDYIKRIIGEPGDEIEIKDKQVYVNGALYMNPHEIHKDTRIIPGEMNGRDNFGPIQVPLHSYFMMGDNRDNSSDSRFWGFVAGGDIIGQAFVKFWSWDQDTWSLRWNRIGRRID